MALLLAVFLMRYEYELPVPDRNDNHQVYIGRWRRSSVLQLISSSVQARPLGVTYYLKFEKAVLWEDGYAIPLRPNEESFLVRDATTNVWVLYPATHLSWRSKKECRLCRRGKGNVRKET